MGTIIDTAVPAGQFALRDTFQRLPGAEFEAVRVAAHDAASVLSLFWTTAPDSGRLEAALNADESLKSADRLMGINDRTLYRFEWDESIRLVIQLLLEKHGTILDARAHHEQWEFRVLFPDHESLSATYECWQDNNMEFSIRRVKAGDDLLDRGGVDLSQAQYEALTYALERDFYGIPRGKTLQALAEELDVSHQALSERIRRGHRNLVANTLCDGSEPVPHPSTAFD